MTVLFVFLGLVVFVFALSLMFSSLESLETKKSYLSGNPDKYIKAKVQSRPTKTVVGPHFNSIKEVLDYHLQDAPDGCLWHVERVNKSTGTFARVALVTPHHKQFFAFVLLLKDTPDRLKDFEKELKFHVKIVLDAYKQHLAKMAAQEDISDKWDGVYNKDVL